MKSMTINDVVHKNPDDHKKPVPASIAIKYC